MLDELIERATLGGELMIEGLEPPSASVNFGAAGLAYAMLRIAQQREDGSLLAVADIWSQASLRDIQSSGATAFTAPDLEMSPELVGHVSLYHSSPGVLCVAALVADAQADEVRRKQAVERFVAAAAAEEARAELVFGLAGPLLGCGLLLDAVGSTPGDEESMLDSLGNDLSRRLLDQLGRLPVIGDAGIQAAWAWHMAMRAYSIRCSNGRRSRKLPSPETFSRASNSSPDWRSRSVEVSPGPCRHKAAGPGTGCAPPGATARPAICTSGCWRTSFWAILTI